MTTLHIETLGHLRIHIGDDKLIRFVSRRAELLVVYLAVTQRPHSRESLATLLWDDRDQKQALANFRSLLARLPKPVKSFLQIERHSVGLVGANGALQVDALRFERLVEEDEGALALYQGAFLAGVHVRESRGLEEWMVAQRERFGRIAHNAHSRLAHENLYTRQFETAIDHARALVKLDPLHEENHRLLMRLLAKNGQFNGAHQAYVECRAVLDEELAIVPTPATERMAKRIVTARNGVAYAVPKAPTEMVGRTGEVAQLHRKLDAPDCRLLSLVGMGGMGKTRLALLLAEQRRNDYLDGIFFVPLAELEDQATLEQLAAMVARTCAVTLQPSGSMVAQLFAWLEGREVLLILDNAEHVVEISADFAQQLLAAAPETQMIITSRERLHLRAERVFVLTGLGAGGGETEGAALFDRCVENGGGVVESGALVMEICELVEGSPLAIELAAAAAVTEGARMVAERIRETLDVLKTTMRDMPARHRSLRAVFDHSFRLLSMVEQRVLGKLAVFRGSFSAEAAQAVANAPNKILRRLVAKSLLKPTETGHFSLHEAVRQYAREQLDVTDEQTPTLDAHARHYLTQLAAHTGSPDDLSAIEQAMPNIRAAWHHATSHSQRRLVEDSAETLYEFHRRSGRLREGFDLLETAVNAFGEQDALPIILSASIQRYLAENEAAAERLGIVEKLPRTPLEHALTNQVAGDIALNQGETVEAQKLYSAALHPEVDRTVAWQPERVYLGLARCDFIQGNIEKAAQKARIALDIAIEEVDQHNTLEASMLYGMAVADLGNVEEAHRRFTKAHTLAQQLKNRMSEARALGALGHIERDQQQAIAFYEASLEIWRTIGDKQSLAIETGNLGSVYQEIGRITEAITLYTESRQLSEAIGDRLGVIFCDCKSAELHSDRNDFDRARPYWRSAFQNAREINSDYWLLYAPIGYAWSKIASAPAEAAAILQAVAQHPAANIETNRLIDKIRRLLPKTLQSAATPSFQKVLDATASAFL